MPKGTASLAFLSPFHKPALVPSPGRQEPINKLVETNNIRARKDLRRTVGQITAAELMLEVNRGWFFSVSGYSHRTFILKRGRENCLERNPTRSTYMKDNGGLRYPSGMLCQPLLKHQEAFTRHFRFHKLHEWWIRHIFCLIGWSESFNIPCTVSKRMLWLWELRPRLSYASLRRV